MKRRARTRVFAAAALVFTAALALWEWVRGAGLPPWPAILAFVGVAAAAVAEVARRVAARPLEELRREIGARTAERARFETVVEAMTDGVLALDAELRITLANGAAVRLLGVGPSGRGESLAAAVASTDVRALVSAGALEMTTAEFDVGVEPRRVLGLAKPLVRGQGVVVVLRDITEVRRLERVRQDFVANVSHELRTPVSVVRANAETLLDGALADGAQARRFVEAIARNAERLTAIIADLLELSQLEANRYPIDVRSVPVAPTVHEAIDAVEGRLRAKGHDLAVEVPEGLTISADPRALQRVLVNLLENAAKYTPPGGHVRVLARSETGRVRIEVVDDGPGIPAEHRGRIFERFYRVDPGRSREMGGTGLGLAIVKHIVEAMGGVVGVRPVEPSGAAFWLTLPEGRGALRRTPAAPERADDA